MAPFGGVVVKVWVRGLDSLCHALITCCDATDCSGASSVTETPRSCAEASVIGFTILKSNHLGSDPLDRSESERSRIYAIHSWIFITLVNPRPSPYGNYDK